MSSRSFAAGKSSMPATANITSGKTSLWARPAADICPLRPASPGTADAWAANAPPPPPGDRSATSSTLATAMTAIVPWRNSVGPSTAIAPPP